MAISFRFLAGDLVQAHNEQREWRDAVIERRAPYLGREGYYILWKLPAGAPMWVSRGGWKPDYAVRQHPDRETASFDYSGHGHACLCEECAASHDERVCRGECGRIISEREANEQAGMCNDCVGR